MEYIELKLFCEKLDVCKKDSNVNIIYETKEEGE